ncbi:MAG: iron ABC transporter permease [Desulfobacterales bacterium]|nr:iron ABC transporter permease [Desulfobacterales bacterium]MDJ0915344.1 iron ABC transporter permease [Desulfobacterales bacterium]
MTGKQHQIIGNLRLLWKEPLLLVSIIAIFYFLLVFVVSPIFLVFKASLTIDKQFDLANYQAIFAKRYYYQPFINSIILGVLTATAGTVLGFVFAYAITRTPIPFKRFFRLTATFPIISPPFVVALAAILLFGRSGSLTPLVEKIIGEYSIYGLGGLVLVETIAYGPIAFLVLHGVLQAIDPALEEAAMDLGASRAKVFSSVTLPLAVPGIASAWLLVFIESMADFGNPMVISGNFRVLSVQAFLQITGMYDLSRGSTLAILLLLPTVTAFFLQKYWVSRKSYVTVTGKPTGATIKQLEWYIKLPVYSLCLLFTGIVFLFYGMVIYGSFQKLWGVDATLTLHNYVEMFQVGKDYIIDSLSLSTLATPITGILGVFIAFLIIRKNFIGRGVMEFVSMLTFAVPGTVVGIGYILAFNQRSALFPFILTGTAWIIVFLLIFRNMPVGIRAGIAALHQIDPAIEEASTDLGANSGRTFRKITLPMIAPAFFSGLAFSFVKSMTAISAIIFVVSGNWNLITVAILGFVDNSQYAQAAAMSLLLIVIVLIALGIIQLIVNRVGRGARTTAIVE